MENKKTIGILTHYNVYNQGARLQLTSLSNYLLEKGYNVKVLTYEKNFDFDKGEEKKNGASLKSVFYFVKEYLFAKGIGLTIFNVKKVRAHNQYAKRFSYCPFDADGLDAVIIGSDEVFSIDVGVNKMMYGYGLKAKAVAYAPSFGRATEKELKDKKVYDLIKDGLSSLYSLSARDKHTKDMILSLTGKDVPLVCDPVILYDGKRYLTGKRAVSKKYMIIYSYDRNLTDKKEIAEVKSYAKKHNLKTVSIGTYHKWCDKNIPCDTEEWYSYFEKAECVLTDTFHGYVVSLKNHCNVALFIRESINAFKLRSLSEETGTENRVLKEISEKELERVLKTKPDYSAIDEKISLMVKNSEEYLLNALKGI